MPGLCELFGWFLHKINAAIEGEEVNLRRMDACTPDSIKIGSSTAEIERKTELTDKRPVFVGGNHHSNITAHRKMVADLHVRGKCQFEFVLIHRSPGKKSAEARVGVAVKYSVALIGERGERPLPQRLFAAYGSWLPPRAFGWPGPQPQVYQMGWTLDRRGSRAGCNRRRSRGVRRFILTVCAAAASARPSGQRPG